MVGMCWRFSPITGIIQTNRSWKSSIKNVCSRNWRDVCLYIRRLWKAWRCCGYALRVNWRHVWWAMVSWHEGMMWAWRDEDMKARQLVTLFSGSLKDGNKVGRGRQGEYIRKVCAWCGDWKAWLWVRWWCIACICVMAWCWCKTVWWNWCISINLR